MPPKVTLQHVTYSWYERMEKGEDKTMQLRLSELLDPNRDALEMKRMARNCGNKHILIKTY